MSTLEIGKLTLRFTGTSSDEARRLAQAIANALAQVTLPANAQIEQLQVTVSDSEKRAQPVDWLARQTVAALLREIGRSA